MPFGDNDPFATILKRRRPPPEPEPTAMSEFEGTELDPDPFVAAQVKKERLTRPPAPESMSALERLAAGIPQTKPVSMRDRLFNVSVPEQITGASQDQIRAYEEGLAGYAEDVNPTGERDVSTSRIRIPGLGKLMYKTGLYPKDEPFEVDPKTAAAETMGSALQSLRAAASPMGLLGLGPGRIGQVAAGAQVAEGGAKVAEGNRGQGAFEILLGALGLLGHTKPKLPDVDYSGPRPVPTRGPKPEGFVPRGTSPLDEAFADRVLRESAELGGDLRSKDDILADEVLQSSKDLGLDQFDPVTGNLKKTAQWLQKDRPVPPMRTPPAETATAKDLAPRSLLDEEPPPEPPDDDGGGGGGTPAGPSAVEIETIRRQLNKAGYPPELIDRAVQEVIAGNVTDPAARAPAGGPPRGPTAPPPISRAPEGFTPRSTSPADEALANEILGSSRELGLEDYDPITGELRPERVQGPRLPPEPPVGIPEPAAPAAPAGPPRPSRAELDTIRKQLSKEGYPPALIERAVQEIIAGRTEPIVAGAPRPEAPAGPEPARPAPVGPETPLPGETLGQFQRRRGLRISEAGRIFDEAKAAEAAAPPVATAPADEALATLEQELGITPEPVTAATPGYEGVTDASGRPLGAAPVDYTGPERRGPGRLSEADFLAEKARQAQTRIQEEMQAGRMTLEQTQAPRPETAMKASGEAARAAQAEAEGRPKGREPQAAVGQPMSKRARRKLARRQLAQAEEQRRAGGTAVVESPGAPQGEQPIGGPAERPATPEGGVGVRGGDTDRAVGGEARQATAEDEFFNELLGAARERGYTGTADELRSKFNDESRSATELVEDLTTTADEFGPEALIREIRSRGGITSFSKSADQVVGKKGRLYGDLKELIEGLERNRGLRGASGIARDKGVGIDAMAQSLAEQGWPGISKENALDDLIGLLEDASRTEGAGRWSAPKWREAMEGGLGVRADRNWWDPNAADTSFEFGANAPDQALEDLAQTLEVVDETGPNASAESAASAEALSRQQSMAAKGERFVVFDRAGNQRPLIGPEAVDYTARPGETYGVMDAEGNFRPLDDKGGRPELREGERIGTRPYDPNASKPGARIEWTDTNTGETRQGTVARQLDNGDLELEGGGRVKPWEEPRIVVKDEPIKAVEDILDTGEAQPRLPGAEEARQVRAADTTFKAPQQATGEDFNLGAEITPEAQARIEAAENPDLLSEIDTTTPPRLTTFPKDLTVFHGTPETFTSFDPDVPTFFSEDPAIASEFALGSKKAVGDRPKVIPAKLDAQSVLDTSQGMDPADVQRLADQLGMQPQAVETTFNRALAQRDWRVVRGMLEKGGYDALRFSYRGESPAWMVMHPKQATSTSGAALFSEAAPTGVAPKANKVPTNVRDFMVKQLGYTDEQLAAMKPSEIYRRGREKIKSDTYVAPPAKPKTVATAPEGTPYSEKLAESEIAPELEEFLTTEVPRREAQAAARTAKVKEQRGVPLSEINQPRQRDVAPPITKRGVEAATEAQRTTEAEIRAQRKADEVRAQETLSESQSRKARMQGEQKEAGRKLDAAFDKGDYKSFSDQLGESIERFWKRQTKMGETAADLRRGETGTVLESSIVPGFSMASKIINDPKKYAALAHEMLKNPAIRGVLGGITGYNVDEDDPIRGALYGAILASAGPSGARALARSIKNVAQGKPASVFQQAKNKDVAMWRMAYGPSLEASVPDVFRKVREVEDQLKDMYSAGWTGKVSEETRKGMAKHTRKIVGSVLADAAKEAREAGFKRKAWLLDAYARRYRGQPTLGQKGIQKIADTVFGEKKVDVGEIERHANQMIYRTMIGYAVDSAAQNLTQPTLALLHMSPGNLRRGWGLSLNKDVMKLIGDKLDLPKFKGSDIVSEAEELLLQKGKQLGTKESLASEPGFMLRWSDEINRRTVYLGALDRKGALDKFLKTGKVDADVEKWAMSKVNRTQGNPTVLGRNPFHRGPVMGPAAAFQKFPGLFLENLADAFKDPEARGRAAVASLMGLVAAGQLLGIDVGEMYFSGARPLGIDPLHPGETLKRGLSVLPAARAVQDVLAHATGTATHPVIGTPGKDFLESDLPYLVGGRYAVKFAKKGGEVLAEGLGKHMPESVTDTRAPHTGFEDLESLIGLKSTAQTEAVRAGREAAAFRDKAQREAAELTRDRRRQLEDAIRSHDRGREARIRQGMSKAEQRDFDRRRRMTPYERRREQIPRKRREEFDREFKERFTR
ncbi:MAG: hypothetical protein ABWY78_06285 [Microvirga sp.]